MFLGDSSLKGFKQQTPRLHYKLSFASLAV